MKSMTPFLFRCAGALGGAMLLAACGGGASVAPSSPTGTVEQFLNAVKARNSETMGRLWGTARGPNAGRMEAGELDQRLTVIRIYLEHEQFEILPDGPVAVSARDPSHRIVQVRLTRRGCQPVVPFTLVPYDGGWLVLDVDLSAAGNPARPCRR
jgi:hypothetical protein